MNGPPTTDRLADILLAWYDRHGRTLPWRAPRGKTADPYRVWLSEIMLQQTTVATVAKRFDAFLDRWPTVTALAAAPLEDVLHEWQGLGYYARARNLHACARRVVAEHGGRFPATESELIALPGIGRYTAAAIAAIAFGRRATPVDGNVERVMARLFAVEQPLPDAKAALRARAEALTPNRRPGDYAQAVMDLGATICTPRGPRCPDCPWRRACAARAGGKPETLPRRRGRAPRPTRHGIVFWVRRGDGAVLLRRRPATGLLGGMMEFPSTPWRDRPWSLSAAVAQAPVAADWRAMAGRVNHTFTHFHLELEVVRGLVDGRRARVDDGRWVKASAFDAEALPTLMKKVARHALAAG